MRFKARYLHRRKEKPEYWRTVWGDSASEAMKLAERYTRKGFICAGVISDNLG